ncbi:MAG: rRNA maturation RNase YbeY [Oscillospiraceae bacterium]|nr:rRNA maturation RNase YbeY [Oscillospiraceae bacterium]
MKHEIYVSRDVKNLGHPNSAALIKKAARLALEAEGVSVPCVISAMLTDDEGIRRVNAEFRGVDSATDVLSFPLNELRPGAFDPALCERDMDSGAVLLGDMLIDVPRCESQGEDFGHGYEREISYLTVHSVLHLLGYDHVDEGEMKKQMRAREKQIMGDNEGDNEI